MILQICIVTVVYIYIQINIIQLATSAADKQNMFFYPLMTSPTVRWEQKFEIKFLG